MKKTKSDLVSIMH